MTKDNGEHMTGSSLIDKGLGVLDRAWDVTWALRLVCFILFVDMATVLHFGHGLAQWSAGDTPSLNDVGWIAITLVGFSVTAAIVVPFLVYVVREILMAIWIHLPTMFSSEDTRPYRRHLGDVPTYEFRDLALREKDALLLGMYNDHVRDRQAGIRALNQWAELTAATLLIALADWVTARYVPGSLSLIAAVLKVLAEWAAVVVPVVVLFAGAILKRAWFSDLPPDVIYYPPLDEELRRKEEETRGRF